MAKPRSYQTEAIIIRKTKLGETGRILTLFTPRLGKIQAVAKGVRKVKSKLSGHLELATHSQVTLVRGKNIDTIIGSQTINSFLEIKNDLSLLSYALYFSELVSLFASENAENNNLYELFLNTLKMLGVNTNNELLRRYFEVQLLGAVGYRPQVKQCVSCHKQLSGNNNTFSMSEGGVLCPACSYSRPYGYSISLSCLEAFNLLQQSDFSSTGNVKLKPSVYQELNLILSSYLRYLLERDIKSAAWLDTLKALNKHNQVSLL